MPRKTKARLYVVGRFWLSEPTQKYPDYGICWLDKSARQTRRLSTGETDLERAKEAIEQHHLIASQEKKKDEPAADAMARYFLKHASHIPSADTARQAMDVANECWKGLLVSQCDAIKQLELVTSLRQRGLADSSIIRWLGVPFASFQYAARFKHIDKASIPERLPSRDWGVRTAPRKRRSQSSSRRQLSLQELATLCDITYGRENAFRYFVLAIGTGARPEAIMDLTRAQVDLEHGLINLLPAGRQQNNKYRPLIPMAPALAQWIASWEPVTPEGHYLGFRGKRLVAAYNSFFTPYIRLAKVADCVPYSLRHTIFSWLSAHGIDRWERKRFMGHHRPDGGSTDDYSHYDPKYLRNAAHCIQQLFEELAPLTRVNLLRQSYVDQPPPPDAPQSHWIEAWLLAGGPRLIQAWSEAYPPPEPLSPPSVAAQSNSRTSPENEAVLPARPQMNPLRGKCVAEGQNHHIKINGLDGSAYTCARTGEPDK